MGVLGLAPFLRKKCPEVIKKVPDRLKSFGGKTIVIDGTLITQRLHFAPMPFSHRHVLGWYKLVKELKESDVRTICVFDGHGRSKAKKRELERRREDRKITAIRYAFEDGRSNRLHKLTALLDRYKTLSKTEREKVATTLRALPLTEEIYKASLNELYETGSSGKLQERPRSLNPETDDPQGLPELPDFMDSQGLLQPHLRGTMTSEAAGDAPQILEEAGLRTKEEKTCEQHMVHDVAANTFIKSGDSPKTSDALDLLPHRLSALSLVDTPPGSSVSSEALPRTGAETPSTNLEGFISKAVALYKSYRYTSTALSDTLTTLSSDMAAVMDDADARTEYATSKHQQKLTLEEGKLWNELCGESSSSEHSAQSILPSLAEKSRLMLQSFRRRMNPPTEQTYEECRTILRAMGVPCVDVEGNFEAEALASALVLNGYADYVASEDTDVLVYEVPLLRNITSRADPLVVVSGKDVRTTLQLDRASYVDFALLLGTDFSQRIKNVGPHRALKYIREHGTIERVLEQETKHRPQLPLEDYLTEVEVARSTFRTLPPIPNADLFEQLESSEDEVKEILQRFGLHRAAMVEWDYEGALDSNYFDDNAGI